MTAYLTPARFKTTSHGASFTGMSDLDLAEYCEDTTAITDAYCAVPYGHSFLGGVVLGEQRPWHYPDSPIGHASRKVFPKHTPVVSVEGFRLVVGSEASANLPVDSLVINNQKGWVEVTSASIVGSSGIFGVSGWIVPFGGLEQPIAELDYTYGWDLPTSDRLYPVGDSTTEFQAPHGHWVEDATAPTISAAGVDVVSGFTIDYEEGRVTFDDDPGGVVRATYRHKLQREIARAQPLIMADLLGASKLIQKDMVGLQRIKAGEIEIERIRPREGIQSMASYLSTAVPAAALLLDGFRQFSAA